MSNVNRHRHGAKNPVRAEVASATVIESGDLIMLISNAAVPFSSKANASIADCSDYFLGVAMQASASGETEPIRVATTGVFEFPTKSNARTAYLGYSAEPSTGTSSIEDQMVSPASSRSNPVGIVIPTGNGVGGTAETTVLVDIQSAIMGNVLA